MSDVDGVRVYHRKVSSSNASEIEKVERSMEIWGREAHVLAGGLCVQAYPGPHSTAYAYSFGCDIPPREKFGFLNGRAIVREVAWHEGMPRVETRGNGEFACIAVLWLAR